MDCEKVVLLLKVRTKQIDDLDAFFSDVIIGVKKENNIVTLTKFDGTAFSFAVPEKDYSELIKGDKGPVGDKGLSAYEVYQNNGGTLSEISWLESLHGEQGDCGDYGDPGIDGSDGIDAVNPVIDDVTISQDDTLEMPKIKLLKKEENSYTLDIKIPEGQQGERGVAGINEKIFVGDINVTEKSVSFAKVRNEGDRTFIDFILRRGSKGEKGDDAEPATDSTVPDIKILINMISEDKVPIVTKTVTDDAWNIVLHIPEGKKGITGDQGKEGKRADEISDIYYLAITDDAGFINSPSFNSFKPFAFKLGSTNYFGWSLRAPDIKDYDNGKITQIALTENGSSLLVRTKENHNVFGSVSEGWVPFEDITRMKGDSI